MNEKKRLAKERRAAAKEHSAALQETGKWLSNVSKQDAKKIKKTFSQIIEGPPKQTGWESVEKLVKDGIVGLYQQEK